jgi:hypothetical protein
MSGVPPAMMRSTAGVVRLATVREGVPFVSAFFGGTSSRLPLPVLTQAPAAATATMWSESAPDFEAPGDAELACDDEADTSGDVSSFRKDNDDMPTMPQECLLEEPEAPRQQLAQWQEEEEEEGEEEEEKESEQQQVERQQYNAFLLVEEFKSVLSRLQASAKNPSGSIVSSRQHRSIPFLLQPIPNHPSSCSPIHIQSETRTQMLTQTQTLTQTKSPQQQLRVAASGADVVSNRLSGWYAEEGQKYEHSGTAAAASAGAADAGSTSDGAAVSGGGDAWECPPTHPQVQVPQFWADDWASEIGFHGPSVFNHLTAMSASLASHGSSEESWSVATASEGGPAATCTPSIARTRTRTVTAIETGSVVRQVARPVELCAVCSVSTEADKAEAENVNVNARAEDASDAAYEVVDNAGNDPSLGEQQLQNSLSSVSSDEFLHGLRM